MSWQQKFESMTSEQLSKAFEYAKTDVNITDGKLALVTEPLYNDVIAFAIENFLPYEPIAKSLNCQAWSEEWGEYWLQLLKQGMSLAVLNTKKNEVMAICIVDIERSDTDISPQSFKHPANIKYLEYLRFCNEQARFYDHFGLHETVHINILAVSVKYSNLGIGRTIIKAFLSIVNNLNEYPFTVKIECTSNFSKAIVEKQGFTTLYECRYSDYTVGGNMVICNTGEHNSMIVYGKLFDDKSQ